MVMKLTKYDPLTIKFPCFIQRKIDGVRCFIKSQASAGFSRNGQKILNIQHILDELPKGFDWDGEIYMDGGSFAEVAGMLRTKCLSARRAKKLKFYVFDVKTREPFEKRLEYLQKLSETSHIKVAETLECGSHDDILRFHSQFKQEGYEGSVVRSKSGLYTHSESIECQKLKDSVDSDFRITGWSTGDNSPDQVVWICESNGNPFTVRPRGTDDQRREWLQCAEKYIGQLLTVQYKEIGVHGVPREPIGLGIRYEEKL